MSSISNWKYKKEIINKGTLHNFIIILKLIFLGKLLI